jgi:hypothetical protein
MKNAVSRLQADIPTKLFTQFKTVALIKNKSIRNALIHIIQKYVEEESKEVIKILRE